ncbi:MAG: 16S rRNA (cytosine(967)-C(5))-methyltransferase RsmB [Gammaproteobacteria bacterium]
MDARATAARILSTLLQNRQTLDQIMPGSTQRLEHPKDRAFVRELCHGVLRWYFQLDFILDKLLTKPLRSRDCDIRAVLFCGLYQLDHLRIPDHAAVSATVEAASSLNKEWAKQLINAVLRRYQRERDLIQKSVQAHPSACYAHPDWLLSMLQQDWPGHWRMIMLNNNQHPPMHLRVNRLLTDRNAYLLELTQAGLSGITSDMVNSGIRLASPVDVDTLPGFREGRISIQDFGAQLAVALLDVCPGHRVLDCCAAPGGKTAQIFETEPRIGQLIAVECDKRRVELLEATRERLHIDVEIIHADVRETADWWDGLQFDRILLDAPCSATGVIRRHPDIKVLKGAGMIPGMINKQYELLDAVWPLLKSGGKLVYATCSLLCCENDRQIEKFTTSHADARVKRFDAGWGIATNCGHQTLPGYDETDGFYYAVMERA